MMRVEMRWGWDVVAKDEPEPKRCGAGYVIGNTPNMIAAGLHI